MGPRRICQRRSWPIPKGDHARAQYVLAQIAALDGEPQKAREGFEATLKMSKDPRTLAWSHIYLGRLYDSEREPQREKAVAEYKAALSVRDAQVRTQSWQLRRVLKTPFAAPRRVQQKPAADDDDLTGLDPDRQSGKGSLPARSSTLHPRSNGSVSSCLVRRVDTLARLRGAMATRRAGSSEDSGVWRRYWGIASRSRVFCNWP